MDSIEVVARLVLAAVFFVAALTKLADRAGTVQALRDFGVPGFLAQPGATLLPLAEQAVVAGLLVTATASAGAIGALVLLGGFCAGIIRVMARGEAPDCHCFGQLHSEPVGASTLIRNAGLVGLAVVALIGAGDGGAADAFGWIADVDLALAAAITGGLALITAAALAFLGLLRRHGQMLLRVEALEAALKRAGIAVEGAAVAAPGGRGLKIGTDAPGFHLEGVHGDSTTLEALLAAERPLILLFTDPGCGPCAALLPKLAAWQRDRSGELTIALIARGSEDDNRAKASEHGVDRVFVEVNSEVSTAYEAEVTPSAVLVNPDGTIASKVSAGEVAIAALVESVVAPRLEVLDAGAAAKAASLGDPVPEFELTDLDGEAVAFADALDGETLVLFWNPGCGYCSRMIPELIEWERERPEDVPGLLLISTGSAEANREMGLASPILLDGGFGLAGAFGARGTPSGVVIGADGTVASELAVGAPACFALAGKATV